MSSFPKMVGQFSKRSFFTYRHYTSRNQLWVIRKFSFFLVYALPFAYGLGIPGISNRYSFNKPVLQLKAQPSVDARVPIDSNSVLKSSLSRRRRGSISNVTPIVPRTSFRTVWEYNNLRIHLALKMPPKKFAQLREHLVKNYSKEKGA